MEKKLVRLALVMGLAGASFVPAASLFAQGLLTPPGAPAPTMKTLDQVEARIDINKLAGDGTAVRVISAPGSYYLTADLSGTSGKDTIRVATSGRVTIDLNGFNLQATASGRTAIHVPNGVPDDLLIRNGGITASAAGALAIGGLSNHVVCEDLRIVGSGVVTIQLNTDGVVRRCRLIQGGIYCSFRGLVTDSTVYSTADDTSINLGDEGQITNTRLVTARGHLIVGERGLISDCQVNSGGPPTYLINATVLQGGASSIVRNCTVKGGSAVDNAIGVGRNSLVSQCRVSSVFRDAITASVPNVTVESCSVEGFGRLGIRLGSNARVHDCVVNSAGALGMSVGDDSVITGSSVSGSAGGGITTGDGCTIRDTTVSQNDGDGISAGSHCTIEHCIARGNQGNGIVVGGSCLVSDCVTSLNGKKASPFNANSDGIEIIGTARTRVVGCNTFSNAGHGIACASANNRNFIEGCLAHSNDGFAISLQGNGNTVIRNQVGGNTGGTISQTGGNIAPVLNASTAVGSMHPLANFP